jgi:hypothetical protein
MKKSSCAIGAVLCAVTATAIVGCGGSSTSTTSSSSSAKSSSSSSSSASPSAAAADYGNLLIKASDIELPGDTFTADPPMLNPGGKDGVATAFNNQTQTRIIGDTILVLPDAESAKQVLDASSSALDQSITDPQPIPAEVGTNGTMAQGLSPDGTKQVAVLLFAEGKAIVTMEFDSAPGDIVPPDFVTTLGQKQADAIKAGLPA